jgi:hypothetical protein
MQLGSLSAQVSTQVSIVAIVWPSLIWREYWVLGEERKKSVQIVFQEWKFLGVREAEWGLKGNSNGPCVTTGICQRLSGAKVQD